MQGHTDEVNCINLMPNGNLISGSDDCTIKIWNVDTCDCVETFKDESAITNIFLLDENFMVVNSDGCIKMCCLSERTGLSKSIKDEVCTCLAVLPNHNMVTCLGDKFSIVILDKFDTTST